MVWERPGGKQSLLDLVLRSDSAGHLLLLLPFTRSVLLAPLIE